MHALVKLVHEFATIKQLKVNMYAFKRKIKSVDFIHVFMAVRIHIRPYLAREIRLFNRNMSFLFLILKSESGHKSMILHLSCSSYVSNKGDICS